MGDDHEHPQDWAAVRTRALESLLVEKGILSTDAIDEVVRTYEQDIVGHDGQHSLVGPCKQFHG